MKRALSIVSGLMLLTALGLAGPASAAVTLGSAAVPAGSARAGCGTNQVRAQYTDNPSNPYFVPGTGRITQWQTNSSFATVGEAITFVVLKPVAGGSYTVVGADARTLPSPLPSSGVTTFALAAPIAVTAGWTLGLAQAQSACLWNGGTIPAASTVVALDEVGMPAPGQTLLQTGFSPISPPSYTMDVAATFIPDNTFSFGGISRNKKKGTATETVNLPNAGDLIGSGDGAKVAGAGGAVISKAVTAGQATLKIKAKGKQKKKLNSEGKVKLNVAITYTPTGGDPSTQSVKVKLKKKT